MEFTLIKQINTDMRTNEIMEENYDYDVLSKDEISRLVGFIKEELSNRYSITEIRGMTPANVQEEIQEIAGMYVEDIPGLEDSEIQAKALSSILKAYNLKYSRE